MYVFDKLEQYSELTIPKGRQIYVQRNDKG